jgi:hypothetical protein
MRTACLVIVLLLQAGAARTAPTPGLVRIVSEPAGLDAWCDQRYLGRTPVETQCGPGQVRIQVREPSDSLYRPAALDSLVQVAQAETLLIRALAPPLVTVRSIPYGLPILRDGVRIGDTPLQLRIGRKGRQDRLSLLTWRGPVLVPVDTLLREGTWMWRGGLPTPPQIRRGELPLWRKTGRNVFPFLALAFGVGGALMENAADASYDRYRKSSDPDDIERHYDRTRTQDRVSTLLWVGAEMSLVGSIVSWILPLGDPPVIPGVEDP